MKDFVDGFVCGVLIAAGLELFGIACHELGRIKEREKINKALNHAAKELEIMVKDFEQKHKEAAEAKEA